MRPEGNLLGSGLFHCTENQKIALPTNQIVPNNSPSLEIRQYIIFVDLLLTMNHLFDEFFNLFKNNLIT